MNTKWVTPLFLSVLTLMVEPQNVCSQDKQGQEKTERYITNWFAGLNQIKQQAGATESEFSLFTRFHQHYLDSERCTLFQLSRSGALNASNIEDYLKGKKQKLQALYSTFQQIKKDYPTSVEQFRRNAPITLDTCFPSCTNIDFNAGNFTGWSGFYGVNSSITSYNITSITGGLLGPVVRAALDPLTANTFQMHITSKPNVDWFLKTFHGINMSQASPWGGNFAAMIGDSINNGAGVAILSQKFFVSPNTTNLTYQYSVFLENPNHPYFEQPFFRVAILDQNGDTIPNCGQYVVVSNANIPGFVGEYYPPRGDTIYWKNWTVVNVPLTRYVGQCVTVVFEVADCELGGHCGYAYVAASCSPLAIFPTAPIICGSGSVILSAPAGASNYFWTGPANSILSSDTLQNITVDSAGTYTVVITPVTGAQCRDTMTVVVRKDPKIKVTATLLNVKCFGTNTGSITATASGGTNPYNYSWTPTGGTNATANGLSAGRYIVFVTDSFGCPTSDTITLTQPALLTTTAAAATNVLCNGGNTGSAKAIPAGGTSPYTYLWNPTAQTNSIATGLSAGNYTITITDANGCTATASTTITQPPVLTAVASGTNVSCFGGSNGVKSVVTSGGTKPYKYFWASCGCTEDTVYGIIAGTYSVVVTDTNGCTATAIITITQPTPITVTLSSANVICNGGNNGSATITAGGGTGPYVYFWNPTSQTSSSATGLSAGNYTVMITDSHGCRDSSTAVITQPALLTVSVSVTTNVSCNSGNNGSASASAGGGTSPYTYLWNPSSQTSFSATGLSAGNYTITITDSHGCTATASTTITQPTVLVASAATASNILCNGGNNGSANAAATGGTNPYTYLWNPSNQTTSSATGLSAGNYTITITDANGCTSTANTVITQPLTLTATTNVVSNVFCNSGNNGSASVSVNGGTSPYTYSWNPSSQTTALATGLSAGNYTVTITDANGCTAISKAVITQPFVLTASVMVTTNVSCNSGNNGSASASISGGTSPYTYMWSPTNQTTSNATGLSAGNYTVTIIDANGCSVSSTIIITQPTTLTASASSTNINCYNGANGSVSVLAGGGTLPYTYSWSPCTSSNSSVSGLIPGTYIVVVTDANGCNISASALITQPRPLSVLATTNGNVNCNGGATGSASAIASGGVSPYTYIWNPSGQTTASASGLSAGIYSITVTDSHGCSTTATTSITQPTALLLKVSGSQLFVCSGQPVNLSASVSGGNAPYTYNWSNGNTASAFTVIPYTTTTFTISITDAHGCSSTGTITISVNAPLIASVGKISPICPGQTVFLMVNATGGDGNYKFIWMPGSSTSQGITVTLMFTTTYTVIVSDGCNSKPDTVNETVVVNPLPDVMFGNYEQGCAPLCVQFSNGTKISSGSISQWYWDFGDGTYSTLENPNHCYTNPGVYSVSLTATSNSGCSASLQKANLITVYGVPVAAFTPNPQPTDILNPLIQFTDESTDKNGIAAWSWNFGEPGDSNTSFLQNPEHLYKDTGTYRASLVVVNVHGCVDSVAHEVIIGPGFSIYFPNAFSPNADGMNDFFSAKGTYVKDFEMYIYDRWGMKLFYTNNINEGWNGTVNGGNTVCQEDTYVYLAYASDMKGNKHQYLGKVTLIK